MNPGDTRSGCATTRPDPPLNEGRGVNPGDTPPSPPPPAPRRPLNEGRGVNPGDTRGRAPGPSDGSSLNEGRGVNPGDTAKSATRAVLGRKRRAFPMQATCSAPRAGPFYGFRSNSADENSRERAERRVFPCFRPESPRVRRLVRGPTAGPVHGPDCDRTGAWHLAVVRGSGRRSPNRDDCR